MNTFLSVKCVLAWLCMAFCAAVSFAADDKDDAGLPLEMHKTGDFGLEGRGIPGPLYLDIAATYNEPLKPAFVAEIRSGRALWILDEELKLPQFNVIVPTNYDPNVPHGILVFVSANDAGKFPRSYTRLLEKYHVIGIAAEESGNKNSIVWRHGLALVAVHLLKARYTIDDDRIYITGTSGGGRLASQAMVINCDVFSGGLPMAGANACVPMENYDSDGKKFQDPGAWPKANPTLLRRAATQCRFAFLICEKDYNRPNERAVAQGYLAKGFKYVTYIEEPGGKHGAVSDEYFEKGLQFVDAPLVATAKADFDAGKKALATKRVDAALAAYRRAVAHGVDAEWLSEAKTALDELSTQYREALSSAESAVAGITPDSKPTDVKPAELAIASLRKAWPTVSKADADRLTAQLRNARTKPAVKK